MIETADLQAFLEKIQGGTIPVDLLKIGQAHYAQCASSGKIPFSFCSNKFLSWLVSSFHKIIIIQIRFLLVFRCLDTMEIHRIKEEEKRGYFDRAISICVYVRNQIHNFFSTSSFFASYSICSRFGFFFFYFIFSFIYDRIL